MDVIADVLGKVWTNVERSVQTASTPFNICESKGNVEAMLNESLNQYTSWLHFAKSRDPNEKENYSRTTPMPKKQGMLR